MSTPYDAPIPGASGYATAALGAATAYQNTLARINAKRTSTLRNYGYLGDIDPTSGTVKNLRVDPHNQYGGLQQMLRGNAEAQQGAQFQAEERGLHGGLAHKAVADVRYDLGNATQQLGTAFTGSLGGFQDEQNQAAYDRDRALYEAELQAARDAAAAQDFNPADFTDTDYTDPTDNGNPSGAPATAGAARRSSTSPLGGVGYGPGSTGPGVSVAGLVRKANPKPRQVSAIPHDMRPKPKPKPTAAASVAAAAAKKKKGR